MTEIARIVEQLTEVHDGNAWHGPSVREALEGVSAAGAATRPVGAAHSVWEIVHHMRVTDELVRTRLSGEDAPGDDDWPTLTDTSEKAWRAAVAGLEKTQQGLRAAASNVPDARLHEKIPGQEQTYWQNLLGVMHHDLYHAGQISLLKKGL